MIDESEVVGVLHAAVDAVRVALTGVSDWRRRGSRAGQYEIDLVADAAALSVLTSAGLAVLSEESGMTAGERSLLVVVDPVDGSTNASRGIPWYAASMCAVDADGPLAAVVTNLATGESFEAVRGAGATREGA